MQSPIKASRTKTMGSPQEQYKSGSRLDTDQIGVVFNIVEPHKICICITVEGKFVDTPGTWSCAYHSSSYR